MSKCIYSFDYSKELTNKCKSYSGNNRLKSRAMSYLL